MISSVTLYYYYITIFKIVKEFICC